MDLRLTRRALADLGLPLEWCRGRSAWDLAGLHDVIAELVELESRPSAQQEPARPSTPGVRMLRADNWHGLVWDDDNAGVTWLLAVVQRDPGSMDTPAVTGGHQVDLVEHLPTREDYEDLERPADEHHRYISALAKLGPELWEAARANLGTRVIREVDELFTIALTIDPITIDGAQWVEVRISTELKASNSGPPSPAPDLLHVLAAVAAILPSSATLAELTFEMDYPVVRAIWRTPAGL